MKDTYVSFIVEFDVFILLFVDHLKMKKILIKKNSSDLHTTHKPSSVWEHVVDHPSHPGIMLKKVKF